MIGRAILAGAALTIIGCAHSSVVLLPDEGGGAGEVAIVKRGTSAKTVMTDANSRATLSGSRPVVRALGAKGLNPSEAALLASLPPAARSFTLYFHEGTTDLTPASQPILKLLRAEVAQRPGAEVQVTGHTDTVGSALENDALSRKRADEILSLLASRGFNRSMMIAVGRGERELKMRTADNVSNAANRRVEVIVR